MECRHDLRSRQTPAWHFLKRRVFAVFLIYVANPSDQRCMKYSWNVLRMLAVGLFLLAHSASAVSGTEKSPLRSGRVVSAAVNGHGENSQIKSPRYSGQDIWWNYIISTGDLLYSVVSRENPSKIGLLDNAPVQFYEAKNWIYIPQPKGKPLALKILNKSKKN
jgi:hypothetical protein